MTTRWTYDEVEIRIRSPHQDGTPGDHAAPTEAKDASAAVPKDATAERLRDLVRVGVAGAGANGATEWPYQPAYPVEARSSEGEAQGELPFQFKPEDVASLLNRGPWSQDEFIDRLGAELFNSLFQGQIGTLFELSHRAAVKRRQGLRLRLRIDPPELAALPWEILRHPTWRIALAQAERTPVVRHVDLLSVIEPLAVGAKLQVLLVAASPSGLGHLDLAHERDRVAAALQKLGQRVEVTTLADARVRDLEAELGKDRYHVAHFMLHGDFLKESEQGLLALLDESGKGQEVLFGDDLGRMLFNSPSTRLVVLNACRTAADAPSGGLWGVAGAAVRLGIPAVVAMQYPVTDDVAIEFAEKFYLGLVAGCGVDQAVARARGAVRLRFRASNEWLTPVLYLRARETVLLEESASHLPQWEMKAPQVIEDYRRKVETSKAPSPTSSNTLALTVSAPASGGGGYVVTAVSAAGRASGQMRLPAGIAELDPTGQFCPPWARADLREVSPSRRVRRLTSGHDKSAGSQEADLEALGEELFRGLLSGALTPLYRESRKRAGASGLRLSLTVDAPGLELVPWEILRDPDLDLFLASAGASLPFRRQVPSVAPPPQPLELPLRVLLVTCAPKDLPSLELEREWDWLQPVQQDAEPGQIRIERLKDPTVRQLLAQLEKGQYHVVHFAGYDSFAISRGQAGEGIVLLTEDETAQMVRKDYLAQLLSSVGSLQLFVANTCWTASHLAPALVRAGVRSAVGMRFGVADDVAVRFTYLFYRYLLKYRLQVDAALAETRKWLLLETGPQFVGHWSYPSLCTSAEGDDFFLT